MPYPQEQQRTASKTLSTALRDKAATHNRLHKAKPIPAGSRAHNSGVSGDVHSLTHL